MQTPYLETLWLSLLRIKERIMSLQGDFQSVVISLNGSKGRVFVDEELCRSEDADTIVVSKTGNSNFRGNYALFTVDNLYHISLKANTFLNDQEVTFLKIYLPYCFLPLRARAEKRAFAVSHFAQSLDGRIATCNGHSQWIGNDENLIHAHRMRSLCDAVLIGSKTLIKDRPALTVRHVKGPDPLKVVVGTKDYEFGSLLKGRGELLHVSSLDAKGAAEIARISIRKKNGILDCNEILQKLFHRGVFSVYIEGGGYTTSCFLNAKAIDVIQLHISPIIMGSGIAGFSLPQIAAVDESLRFSDVHFYPQGDHILFTGTVKY